MTNQAALGATTTEAGAAVVGDATWVQLLPEAGREWAPAIEAAAASVGMDPRLLASVVWTESSFTPDAVSSAGAIGLAQLMPGTAQLLGVDPWNPQQNLEGGARYLAHVLERFGSVDSALAAYNAGPGRVEEAGGPPSYTHGYISRVLEHYRELGGPT
jgi:soluble lytic murein transglycosylase-like protein